MLSRYFYHSVCLVFISLLCIKYNISWDPLVIIQVKFVQTQFPSCSLIAKSYVHTSWQRVNISMSVPMTATKLAFSVGFPFMAKLLVDLIHVYPFDN